MRIGRAVTAAIVAVTLVACGSGSEPARSETPSADHPLLGVVVQRSFDLRDTAMMSAAGLDSIRTAFFWGAIEPEPGKYNWVALDFLVATAAENDLVVLPYLTGEPDWAIERDGFHCRTECRYAPATATTRQAFAEFAAAAVRRYGPDGSFWVDHPELPYVPIRAWQIWNEQNSKFFYRPAADPASYAALLRATAPAMRLVDPDAEIILGGMWSAKDRPDGVIGSAHYLRELYQVPGARQNFDSIAIHPYAPQLPNVFSQIEAMRRVARRFGDGAAGLWVTELGWSSGGKPAGLVKDPARQAELLTQGFGRLLDRSAAYHLRGAYWYAWRDTKPGDVVCQWCRHAGLIWSSGRPKPAYHAMRTLSLDRD
jgi:polysaccharide biosynthesis protein PslG